MDFNEFSEFKNPEGADYDVKSSLDSMLGAGEGKLSTDYKGQIINMIGIFEDVTDEELNGILIDNYGITLDEYNSPTQDTVDHIKNVIEESKSKESSERHI